MRAATAADYAGVVALNQAHVEHLSDLTIAALARLADTSQLRIAALNDRREGLDCPPHVARAMLGVGGAMLRSHHDVDAGRRTRGRCTRPRAAPERHDGRLPGGAAGAQ